MSKGTHEYSGRAFRNRTITEAVLRTMSRHGKVQELDSALIAAGFSVAKMAAAEGLSLRQFERKFALQFKACPRKVALERRMMLAVELLLGNESIKEIAFKLGYQSACNFTHALRHYTGLSPTELRREIEGGNDVTQGHVAFSQNNGEKSQSFKLFDKASRASMSQTPFRRD